MTGYLFLALAFILNSLGTIAVKVHALKGFQVKGAFFSLIWNNIFFLAALALFGLNLVAYSLALSRLPLSVAYPIMTVASFVIVNAFSFFYFREHITLMQVVGYILILTGITFVITFARS
jgi:multidrug transporter EmrE-like cation transporter